MRSSSSSAGIDSVQLGGLCDAASVGAFNRAAAARIRSTASPIPAAPITSSPASNRQGERALSTAMSGGGKSAKSAAQVTAFGQCRGAAACRLAYVHVRDGSFLESGGVAALSGSGANENTEAIPLRSACARRAFPAAGQRHAGNLVPARQHAAVAVIAFGRCDP